MAGSYRHCCNTDGSFIGHGFVNMIENLSDAHEACEMMHFMIRHLANGDLEIVRQAEDAYYLSVNPSYVRQR